MSMISSPWIPSTLSAASLLGRTAEVRYSRAARRLVAGSCVLVTGAGGSIGSEIVRQLRRLRPGAVYLLDHDECALQSVQLELAGHGLLDDDHFVLGDVRDQRLVDDVMRWVRPDVVYHAAAHKHLPLLERYPAEGVKTNVIGTQNVVSAAVAAGVGKVVNISTDKAARPTSVLGLTKRVAEQVVASHAGGATAVCSVRFGNVLGSRGSFLPLLAYQVASGRPVTVTHRDAARYFMTIPEAAGLVIESSAMARRGETYVLDMGAPVRILDLVRRFFDAVGVAPTPTVAFTGLRPGEKLTEDLVDGAERQERTDHQRIFVVHATSPAAADFPMRIKSLALLARDGRGDELTRAMTALLAVAGVEPRVVDLRDDVLAELPLQRHSA
ncbi:MAG TPA: polysaccharide biosynthesis protein [Actinomycetales bacterium]|nr:polysaccharide biosynthesis protein [Actinomycetales bacterium]